MHGFGGALSPAGDSHFQNFQKYSDLQFYFPFPFTESDTWRDKVTVRKGLISEETLILSTVIESAQLGKGKNERK